MVVFSCSVVSDSFWPHGLQHTSPSFIVSQSLLKPMSIESMVPSNHLILCCSLLILPSMFSSIGLFQWVDCSHQVPKYIGASASVLPVNIQGWSSLTFSKRLFSFSSLSAIYLRLLIFLMAILIPAYDSSSLTFCMMYSTCELNKQGDSI